jgi:Ras-related protein Rab-32
LAKENLTNNNEQMNEFCRDKGFAGWYETSAKDDINVETAAKFLVSKVSIANGAKMILF